MPDENSFNERTLRTAESLPSFCAKKIASVISSIAMAVQNLTVERCLPYKAESREFLRADGEASGVCM
jgi:hypothetical protein